MQNLDNSDLEVKNLNLHQDVAAFYLPIFQYGSECWAITKRDAYKTDTVNYC